MIGETPAKGWHTWPRHAHAGACARLHGLAQGHSQAARHVGSIACGLSSGGPLIGSSLWRPRLWLWLLLWLWRYGLRVLLVSTGFGVRLLLLVSDGVRLPNRARPALCPCGIAFTIPTWQRLVY